METTRAIVLSTLRYGDDRIIVHLYTETRGMVACVFKQTASKRKSMHGALWQIMSVLELNMDYKANRDFQFVKDVRIAYPWTNLYFDPVKTTLCMFLAEFLYQALKGEGENRSLWNYLLMSLQWLDSSERGFSNFHIVMLTRMMTFLGFMPSASNFVRGQVFDMVDGVFTSVAPSHGQYIETRESGLIPLLLKMNYQNMWRVKMNRAERWYVLEKIMDYYRLHIPEFGTIRSMEVLKEVFS